MKTRYLTVIFLAICMFAAAHAQTVNVMPTLPPVPKTPQLTDDPTSTRFTFIAAGDNRPAGHHDPQPPTLAQILDDSKRFKPAFMLWSGDIIAGFRIAGQKIDRTTLLAQYEEFFNIASKAGVPIFNTSLLQRKWQYSQSPVENESFNRRSRLLSKWRRRGNARRLSNTDWSKLQRD